MKNAILLCFCSAVLLSLGAGLVSAARAGDTVAHVTLPPILYDKKYIVDPDADADDPAAPAIRGFRISKGQLRAGGTECVCTFWAVSPPTEQLWIAVHRVRDGATIAVFLIDKDTQKKVWPEAPHRRKGGGGKVEAPKH